MAVTTLRVQDTTRDLLNRVAREDFGGASADTTLLRLIEEHFQARCIAAMQTFREADPDGYAAYLGEADEMSRGDTVVGDPWDDEALPA